MSSNGRSAAQEPYKNLKCRHPARWNKNGADHGALPEGNQRSAPQLANLFEKLFPLDVVVLFGAGRSVRPKLLKLSCQAFLGPALGLFGGALQDENAGYGQCEIE